MAEMAELAFDLKYDGPALENHEMDVRDLAPALLAAGVLFQAANAAAHPLDPPVGVNVRAMSEGSFLVQLKLAYDGARDALVSDDVTAGVALLTLVTTVGGLIRHLAQKHRSPVLRTEASETPGMIRVSYADGTVLEVPPDALRLERDVRVRRSLADMVGPLDSEGVTTLELRREEITISSIERADVEAFRADLPEAAAELLSDSVREVYLTILSATFQEDRKWRLSDGMSSFYASLLDADFIAKINAGERFSKQDVLHCNVRTRQWRDEGGLHSEVEVLEVIEHLPAVLPQVVQQLGFDDLPDMLELPDET